MHAVSHLPFKIQDKTINIDEIPELQPLVDKLDEVQKSISKRLADKKYEHDKIIQEASNIRDEFAKESDRIWGRMFNLLKKAGHIPDHIVNHQDVEMELLNGQTAIKISDRSNMKKSDRVLRTLESVLGPAPDDIKDLLRKLDDKDDETKTLH